jgi:hypothetical protein
VRLIGMLDSPYVRRTAISLRRLGVAHGAAVEASPEFRVFLPR